MAYACRLEEKEFEHFWLALYCKIDDAQDRLVAYKVDARCAQETRTAGNMVCSEKCVCHLV